MANKILDFLGHDLPEGVKTVIDSTPGVIGGLSGRDYGYGGRYLNSDASFGDFNRLVESLKGLVPGLEGDRRTGLVYDLQRVFDEIHVNNYCTFTKKMGAFMSRLMEININEKAVFMDTIGQNAAYNGDSNLLDPNIPRPSYAEGRNYLDYMDEMNLRDSGSMTTRRSDNISIPNYEKGELYRRTEWLYPDENDTGQFSNKWYAGLNRNSLLYKTKRLFAERKIKTLISRFGTNADPTSVDLDYTSRKGTTIGGESRGRNLLRKGGSGNYNGYNDPYCRVWTHHHQYDRLSKLIRPFSGDDDNTGTRSATLEDMHGYLRVSMDDKTDGTEETKKGVKGWKYSVLSRDGQSNYTGLVNIAPKFLGGAAFNIHTKQCMFSIENLAWRGYNPYEFEKALSWEQRGPLGGRIMWFPPYGLTFSETTNAQWSSNTFIGRGEDVYTYVNTQRTGNLSFLLVVDHPSVLDYALWNDAGQKKWGGQEKTSGNGVTDEEVLQFFAGCDSGDSNDPSGSLFGKANNPTPLTDEYTRQFVDGGQKIVEINPKPKEPETEPEEDSPNGGNEEVSFYLFYPNNCSGVYNLPNEGKFVHNASDAVKYLMCGIDTITGDGNGPGYEMLNSGGLNGKRKPKDDSSAISVVGKWYNKGVCGSATQRKDRKGHALYWGYRVDGRTCLHDNNTYWYDKPPTGDDATREKRSHFLVKKNSSYYDNKSYGLNITPHGEKDVYSAALIYGVLEERDKDGYVCKQAKDNNPETFDKLTDLFKNREIVEFKLAGNASQDGKSISRGNTMLAHDRAMTAGLWVRKKLIEKFKRSNLPKIDEKKIDNLYQDDPSNKDGDGECAESSKRDRCARVTIVFASESKTDKAEAISGTGNLTDDSAQPNTDTQNNGTVNAVGYNASVAEDEILNRVKEEISNTTFESDLFKNGKEKITKAIRDLISTCGELDIKNKLLNLMVPNHRQWGDTSESSDSIKITDILYNGCRSIAETRKGFAEEGKQQAEEMLNNLEEQKKGENRSENVTESTKSPNATKYERYTGFTQITPEEETPRKFKDDKGDIWVETSDKNLESGTGTLRRIDMEYKTRFNTGGFNEHNLGGAKNNGADELNTARYDQEYYFFRQLERHNPIMFDRLVDKLKYFDPAFHSMTPEGFNARLTFLNQCTRQGSTISMSDKEGKTANNMAFGRPPFCVLRVGDFYNQMIVIESINFDYSVSDGIVWDLNPEGVGVQPMLCRVSMNFKFIGGGDLAGPIRRLQNAVSFNYYANTRLYDNRADRVRYNSEDNYTVEGALDWDIDTDNSRSYNPEMWTDDDTAMRRYDAQDIVKKQKTESVLSPPENLKGALTGRQTGIEPTILKKTNV